MRSDRGVIAAPTTSLPETPGGSRNWDYRYCWLRDATFTLLGFNHAGYHKEARHGRTGCSTPPAQTRRAARYVRCDRQAHLQRIESNVATWVQKRAPVRIGNAARKQLQLDIFGELADVLYQAGIAKKNPAFRLLVKLLNRLERIWRRPDHGIWK